MNIIENLSKFSKDYNINLFIGGDYAINEHFGEESKTLDIIIPHDDLLDFIARYLSTEIFNTKLEKRGEFYEIELEEALLRVQSFSIKSFMKNEEILTFLKSSGIANSVFNNNLFGRDFTFQTILYDLKEDRYIDPLGYGLDDLRDKRIKTVLPANLLIKYSPLSILNAIKFSVKYDFFIDKELKHEIRTNIGNLHNFMSKNRLQQNFVSMLDIDEERLIKTIEDYNIDIIPEDIKPDYDKKISE